jgi:hypothetical protein
MSSAISPRASVLTSSSIVHRPASDGCDHGGGLLCWDDKIETFDELIVKRVGHVTPTEKIEDTIEKDRIDEEIFTSFIMADPLGSLLKARLVQSWAVFLRRSLISDG